MKKIGAYHTYLIMVTASAFFFSVAFTTSAIYRFSMANLNPLQLVLLGTALEASVFLFEIPTGIVADVYSRRLSVIIGFTLIGCGMLLEGALQIFITIMAAQIIWGIGYTFISGAQDAWLADEIGEERLTSTYLRGSQFAQLATLLGIVINVSLASIQLNLPFYLAGSGHIGLAFFLLLFMPETGFHPVDQQDRNTWQRMGKTFHDGVSAIRGQSLLTTILGIALVYGLFSEALDRLWEAHILDNFTLPKLGSIDTVVWFGIINAVILIITIGTTEIVRRRSERLNQQSMIIILALSYVAMSLGLFIFGLARHITIALASYTTVAIVRRTAGPLYRSWVNRGIPSHVRATVLSTFGQMDAIGQFIGGPAIGMIATHFGLRAAMVTSGLLLSLVLPLYRHAYRLVSGRIEASQS
ncbi:MAG: MFS transporter [Candidatus Promineifilaceae bacterium]|nr:MFS transporter [Candidatus Promineifilaceae bacterium]